MHRTRFLSLLSLFACSDLPSPGTADTSTSGTVPTQAELSVDVAPSPHVRQVPVFRWDAPDAGRSWVSYGVDKSMGSESESVTGATEVEIPIVGLKAGSTIYYQAHTEQTDGTISSSVVGSVTTGSPFDLQPRPTVTAATPESGLDGGYLLYSVVRDAGQSFTQIIDSEGDIVWSREADPGTMIVTARPALNGTDILYLQTSLTNDLSVAWLHRVALNGLTASVTELPAAHHDFVEHADGTIGFFAYSVDDPNKRASDAVRELAEGSLGEPDEVFDYWADYPYPYWYICEHVQGWQGNPTYDEWTHSNSLMMDPAGEHYYVMSKFMDALLKIRRSDGAVVWQLNGRYGEFLQPGGDPTWNAVGETTLFSHAHMSHIWETPKDPDWTHCMAVFDNGYHLATGNHSSAVEICFNEDTRTAERVFAYPEPNGGFTALMGDVRKLDDSYLVAWSSLRRIDEVDPMGSVRWSLDMGVDLSGGRVSYLSSL